MSVLSWPRLQTLSVLPLNLTLTHEQDPDKLKLLPPGSITSNFYLRYVCKFLMKLLSIYPHVVTSGKVLPRAPAAETFLLSLLMSCAAVWTVRPAASSLPGMSAYHQTSYLRIQSAGPECCFVYGCLLNGRKGKRRKIDERTQKRKASSKRCPELKEQLVKKKCSF